MTLKVRLPGLIFVTHGTATIRMLHQNLGATTRLAIPYTCLPCIPMNATVISDFIISMSVPVSGLGLSTNTFSL